MTRNTPISQKDSDTSFQPDANTPGRHFQAIAALAEFFLRGESIKQVYSQVSGVITDILQLEACLVLEYQRGENKAYHLCSACGFCDLHKLKPANWMDNRQLHDTLETAEVVCVEEFGHGNSYMPPGRDCFREFRSGMSIRIPGEGQPIGVIAVYSSNPRRFSMQEKEFLRTVSNMLAGALSREENENELRESEARLMAILETAVDGIITIDARGHISLFNQAASRIFGYSEEEVLGKNISMLMPEPYRSEHDGYLHNYTTTGKKKIIGRGREMTGLRKDGKTFPLYLAVSEFHAKEGRSFTGIVRDISEQRRLEQEVLNISDHERRRIGQDLHDGLGQMLTGIGLMSRNLEKMLDNEQSGSAEHAAEITSLIRKADEYAKNLSRGLLPVDFEMRGLATSLERLVANAERLFGISCRFQEHNPPVFHDNSVVEHLFRIAQEAISNAVKHGMASEVDLELFATPEYACLKVTDNGRGFTGNWHEKKGSGMDIMMFRAQLIGANLDIRNGEDGGAELSCILPRTETVYRMETE
jgi:two-component system, LuxR family, sensor kinase FixL